MGNNMQNKVVMVTGVTNGIGFEAAKGRVMSRPLRGT